MREEALDPHAAAPELVHRAAAIVLTVLAGILPWPVGGAWPWAARAGALTALGTSTVLLVALAIRGGLARSGGRAAALPAAPYVLLATLGVAQLVPLPPALHAMIAPGSSTVWHPVDPATVSALGAADRPISLHPLATREALSWVLGLGALAALARPALRETRFAHAIAVSVVTCGFLVAVYGVVARFTFGSLLFGTITVPTVSPFGPFVSKNHFAAYVAAIALLALGLAVGLADAARRDRSWLSWVGTPHAARVVVAFGVAAMLTLAVLVSQSRGGAIALGVGGVAFLALRFGPDRREEMWSRRSRIVGTIAALTMVLLVALVPEEGRERLWSVFAAPDASGAFRLRLWRDALGVFARSPLLGHGLGAFGDALQPHKTSAGLLRVDHAENDLVEALVEGGLLGAATVSLGLVLASGWTRRARRRHGLSRGLGLGAAAALVCLLAHSLLDFPLRLPGVAAVATTCFALLAALGSSTEIPRAPKPRARWTLGLAAIVLTGAFLDRARSPEATLGVRHLAAVRQAKAQAERRLSAPRVALAEAELLAQIGSRPADAEAWLHLAWLHARSGRGPESLSLARHAAALDPQRDSIRAYLTALETTGAP